MAQHYSDPKRADDSYSLPDVETFYRSDADIREYADLNGRHDADNPWCDGDGEPLPGGWFYWFCMPGCLPDGDPVGPFRTEAEALQDAHARAYGDDDDDDDDDLAYCAICDAPFSPAESDSGKVCSQECAARYAETVGDEDEQS